MFDFRSNFKNSVFFNDEKAIAHGALVTKAATLILANERFKLAEVRAAKDVTYIELAAYIRYSYNSARYGMSLLSANATFNIEIVVNGGIHTTIDLSFVELPFGSSGSVNPLKIPFLLKAGDTVSIFLVSTSGYSIPAAYSPVCLLGLIYGKTL